MIDEEIVEQLFASLRVVPRTAAVHVHGLGRGPVQLSPTEVRRALSRMTAQSEVRDGCWCWTGYTISGYGAMSLHDRSVHLHRLAYAIVNGPLPAGHTLVRHSCDVPTCWIPLHLLSGTKRDNARDAIERTHPSGFAAAKHPRGATHPMARLTDEQVAEIRSRCGVDQRALATDYGCSQSTIWRILHERVRA